MRRRSWGGGGVPGGIGDTGDGGAGGTGGGGDGGSVVARKVPDTGQTTSYTDTFGEDSDYSINPPSYTDNGDGTITDNVTGLMWQKCLVGRNEDTTCSGTTTEYNWYEASGTAEATYNPGGATNVCGSETTGNYTDWRLPDLKERESIANYQNISGGTINNTYFPSPAGTNWSSTAYAYNSSSAWFVNSGIGFVGAYDKTQSFIYSVRCVRGEQAGQSFTDNGDGTVTDNVTTLMWQQEDDDTLHTWEEAITYCEGLSFASYTNWRLPNIKELRSIVDDTVSNPSIDEIKFPNTNSSFYWSATTYSNFFTSSAWVAYFDFSFTGYSSKSSSHYVRCVR
ncbi:MAG: DUF1566 domain-containing protein [Nitrospinota bacterium]